MKKLLFTLSLQISDNSNPSDIVDQIEGINNELLRRGYTSTVPHDVHTPVASATTPPGPLEIFWCKLKNVKHIRRTDGRTAEEQAAYNLRKYARYTDEQIEQIVENSEHAEPVAADSDNLHEEIDESQLI